MGNKIYEQKDVESELLYIHLTWNHCIKQNTLYITIFPNYAANVQRYSIIHIISLCTCVYKILMLHLNGVQVSRCADNELQCALCWSAAETLAQEWKVIFIS